MRLSDSTKNAIWAIFAARCAKCRKFLLQNTQRLGEVAHIYGRKQGSARYDNTKPNEYLNSVDNLILLCCNCHKEIDTNENVWTPDKLFSLRNSYLAELQKSKQDLLNRAYDEFCAYFCQNLEISNIKEDDFLDVVLKDAFNPKAIALREQGISDEEIVELKNKFKQLAQQFIFKNTEYFLDDEYY